MIGLADVEAAAERIGPHAHRTPVIRSTIVDRTVGAAVFCKAESLQRTGSFKFRGALNAVASLVEPPESGVITYSSGNHGQAIARAAGIRGIPATVVMPTDAPPMKRAATEHWGATIIEYDRYRESRDDVAQRARERSDAVLIPPYDHLDVMAGQGTVALELCDQVPDLDLLVVCVGGGGLLSGCATAATALVPGIRVIGVEPAAGDDHVQSRRAGRRVELPGVPRTIADGQQVVVPGALTWPVTDRLTDAFVTVSDDEIVATMRLLFEHHKLVIEPSGASALAAILHRDIVEPGMRIGVTLSGGNIDLRRFAELVHP